MPSRLKLLIALLCISGIVVGIYGFLYTEGFGLWVSVMLVLFFTAHLLHIPHNSGRYWAYFIAFALFAFSAIRLLVFVGWIQSDTTKDVSLITGLGIPIFLLLVGLQITLLSFHSSVCDFFDSLDPEQKPTKSSRRQ